MNTDSDYIVTIGYTHTTRTSKSMISVPLGRKVEEVFAEVFRSDLDKLFLVSYRRATAAESREADEKDIQEERDLAALEDYFASTTEEQRVDDLIIALAQREGGIGNA